VFANPRPDTSDLSKFYRSNYYSYSPVDNPFAERDEKLYRLFCSNGHYFSKFLRLPYRHAIRLVRGERGARILDIGCGAGHFLATVKRALGFDAYGVEPWNSNDTLAEKHGFTIFHGDLVDARFSDAFFDIVTINQVLEHIPDPRTLMREIRRILRPSGTMVLGLPNRDALLFRIFGKHWSGLDAPRHIFIPTIRSIRALCESEGFAYDSVRGNGSPGLLIETLSRAVRGHRFDDDAVSRPWLVCAAPATYLLNAFQLGDTFETIFRRPA
jgi:SAM-dependent methyltransferase